MTRYGLQNTAGRWLLHGGWGQLAPMVGTFEQIDDYRKAATLPHPAEQWSVQPWAARVEIVEAPK